ncbi:hypothetical protein BEL04_08545 [Mucilaginibacter sp. PPCGB 2223]|uniref:hypothetical protein n=1 Tax=Mucilaginibacter sp. PPCGB 2223 TaxID=1886027 RepID=UPI000825BCAA|nr:hypothetical protein [Mucilaginibacter sp. PPCGB 2223]OCX54297.1 hypothetical protein BEL04_08545 [Mucilaginibacter sp. PPCGB 2223]
MKKKIIVSVIVIVLVSNLPIFNFITKENYSYSNEDGSFRYDEEGGKGRSLENCMFQYGLYLCKHPEKDTGSYLYRTFTIKPWRFWEWGEMIFHSERFKLPYRKP